MEVGMSLNALACVPLSGSPRTYEDGLAKWSLFTNRMTQTLQQRQRQQHGSILVVKARRRRGMQPPQFQKPPPLPKIEDDGYPKFLIFIRMDYVKLWYPLTLITGGTTAKIMLAAKDNFLGKYIYKDTLDRNLAAVIYKDEKELRKAALQQHRVLRSAREFRYGYKLIENGNLRAALNSSDIIELPPKVELKTVLDKVKDFFGEAKDSFGKLTVLKSDTTEEVEEDSKEKAKAKMKKKP